MKSTFISEKLNNSDSRSDCRCLQCVWTLFAFVLISLYLCTRADAAQLDIDVNTKGNSSYITDGSYYTGIDYTAGDTITISAESPINSIYVIWDAQVSEWELTYSPLSNTSLQTGSSNNTGNSGSSATGSADTNSDSSSTLICGTNGFLHEYVKLPTDSSSVTINIKGSSRISALYAFSDGELPDFVQNWNTPCEAADILVFSTHADDEILFLGGVLAVYAGELNLPVQVCYMTNYWNGAHIREHEKLDGLWESGVRNYPINGDFDDIYSETLEAAKKSYNYDDVVEYVTEQVRRFKPNVVVTQDLNGEYGHGGHMLLANAVCDAVDNSADSSFCSESAAAYGTWNVPKTYLHLYSENQIWLDLNVSLNNLGGRTAIETAKDAYLKHVSQQWCWFYVSDTYEYSCAKFGLYRSTVGVDSDVYSSAASSGSAASSYLTSDSATLFENITNVTGSGAYLLEHITTYAQQALIAQEEARLLAEAEAAKNSDNGLGNSSSEYVSPVNSGSSSASSVSISGYATALIVIAAMIILLILMLSYIIVINQKRKRKKR